MPPSSSSSSSSPSSPPPFLEEGAFPEAKRDQLMVVKQRLYSSGWVGGWVGGRGTR